MNANKLTLWTTMLLLCVTIIVQASPPRITRMKARAVLIRTNRVLNHARLAVNEHKVYTGHLRRAIYHQRVARSFLSRGMYLRAVAQSGYARRLSLIAITKNNSKNPLPEEFTAEEKTMLYGAPADEELDMDIAEDLKSEITEEELSEMEDLGIDVE